MKNADDEFNARKAPFLAAISERVSDTDQMLSDPFTAHRLGCLPKDLRWAGCYLDTMSLRRSPWSCLAAVLVVFVSACTSRLSAAPDDWVFTNVVTDGVGGFSDFGGNAVGSDGSVAFIAKKNGQSGLFHFARGTISTILLLNSPMSGGFGTPSEITPQMAIDSAGRVLFQARVSGGSVPAGSNRDIFRWDAGVISFLTSNNGYTHDLSQLTSGDHWSATRFTSITENGVTKSFNEVVITDGSSVSQTFLIPANGGGALPCEAFFRNFGLRLFSSTGLALTEAHIVQKQLPNVICDPTNETATWELKILEARDSVRTVDSGTRLTVNNVRSGFELPTVIRANDAGDLTFLGTQFDGIRFVDPPARLDLMVTGAGGTRSLLQTERGDAQQLNSVLGIDSAGRVSFSTVEAVTSKLRLFSGPSLALDRVIGPDDDLFGAKVTAIQPLGVASLAGTFGDKRVFLFSYELRDAAGTFGVAVAQKERKPVIFIHGVAGSVLKTGSRYIWPTIAPDDVADLHLVNGPANTEAVDVVRTYDVGGLGVEQMQFYGPFLQHMTQERGYVEFDLEEDRSRMTNFFLLNLPATNQPNLFTFPYDWRRPNASHVATLHAFIQRIRELHGGAKVNLVVHSMGGLVMRRYLLEYGTESVHGVVTVGSPIWGAPESAFRMFTGIFFGVGPIDFINSSAMKASVLSMPGVHELNPSSKYLQHWGFPVFTEVYMDYNDNGIWNEGYSASEFRVALDEEAAPQTPALNNITFHGYLGGRQDDWSQDDDSVRFLHIIGKQAVDVTTVGIEVRARTFSLLDLLGSPSGLQVFSRVVGEGDGTVPTLGSQRLPQYYAPGTLVREITEPLPGVLSAKQPAGRGAEHTMLMSNTNVWNLINEFLDTGTLTTPAGAADGGPTLLAAQSEARKQVLVMGCSLVTIRDAQSVSNKVYSGIAVRQIPGVDVTYDSQENWVLVEFDANRDLVVESAAGCAAVEIEVQEFDLVGDPVGLHRYRIVAGTNRWQLALAGNEVPVLAKDADGDGTFEPEEEIAPSHAASGPNTDVHPPDMEVLLSRVNGQIQLIVNGSDAQSPPVTIRYRLNGGPVATYTGAILFAGDSQHTIALFAEDALGHTSGLIQTRLNPELKIGRLAEAFLALEWPKADGYRLESAPGPQGPWRAVTATRLETNGVVKVTTPASDVATLFRLKR